MDLSYLNISGLSLLGLITLIGFYMGRFSHYANLPSLIGYMVLGVLLGPSVLNLFDLSRMKDLAFIADLGLGFVAFSIGWTFSNTISMLPGQSCFETRPGGCSYEAHIL